MMSTSTVTMSTGDQEDRLVQVLVLSGVPALRLVTVLEQEDMVILSGRLPSYYLKQLAQEALIPHLGHRVLENRITVKQH